MELDFSEIKLKENGWLLGLGIFLGALLLAALGWYIQPERVLTWTEWQVYRQQAQYRDELQVLTHQAERLAALLDETPHPVRAQLIVEQLNDALATKVSLVALADQEVALRQAGEAALQWSLGALPRDPAVLALDAAQQLLVRASAAVTDVR